MEREELIKKINSIKDRVTVIDNEREALVQELKDILPIKVGDKVNICNRDGDKFVRFAFVNRIEIKPRGSERKANLEFDLQKCKSDGTISQHSDYLKFNEYINKIK